MAVLHGNNNNNLSFILLLLLCLLSTNNILTSSEETAASPPRPQNPFPLSQISATPDTSPAPDNHNPPPPPPPSPPPPPPPFPMSPSRAEDTPPEGEGGELSGGQKAGIVIGTLAGTGLLVLGGLVYKRRQSNIRRARFGRAARRPAL